MALPTVEDCERAFEVVLDELTATSPIAVVRSQWALYEDDGLIMVSSPNSAFGLLVPADEPTADDVLAAIADRVQDWAVEELNARGLPATWPECPRHPNGHPLDAVSGHPPVWACPRTGTVVGPIGGLGPAIRCSEGTREGGAPPP